MVFPVVLYGCESWTVKKAECQIIDAFELWCWRRLLRVPWTARRSNQSTLKEISPGYSLEGLMLKWNSNTLATWCEELTHLKRPWCWEKLKAGEGDDRGWDGWMASPTQWRWVWVNYESCIKKAEHWRIDTFELVLEKTLESPLDCKEIKPVNPIGNQSWIFIGRTYVEAEISISGYLMQRTDSLEKTLMLGKIEGGRRRGQQRMKWLDGITNSMNMS